jgi:hypothetical protein
VNVAMPRSVRVIKGVLDDTHQEALPLRGLQIS